MFHSSSSSVYTDPTFRRSSVGQPSVTGTTIPPYYDAAAATLFDATPSLSSSLPSNNYFTHRSSSTHSFAHHHHACSVPDPTTAYDLLDFQSEPFRRVFSTGDLHASTDNCIQEAGAAVGRVGRYTAEERMKRIERYRSKRNQRNFHKKITYACRKTLADSRPRVRGRFARNGEAETETEPEPEASETSCESYNHHKNDNGGNAGEWWRQMQAALLTTTVTGEEECCYDEDLWASFDSVFSMNLLS